MKNVLHLLIGCALTLTSLPSGATSRPQPADQPAYKVRALQLACFYTDALRLSSSQASAVKEATNQELLRLSQLEEAEQDATPGHAVSFTVQQVLQQYDAAMLQILTPGQYNAFHLLQDRQPGQKLQLPGHVAHK